MQSESSSISKQESTLSRAYSYQEGPAIGRHSSGSVRLRNKDDMILLPSVPEAQT